MTSSTGKQIITIHLLSYISRSKDNQTMKFNQLIEWNKAGIFLKNHVENEAERLQSWPWYFGTLQYFSTDPIYHK